jgi:hypothetical protein
MDKAETSGILYSLAKADNERMDEEKSRLVANLAANIDDILNGTPKRKKELEKHIFFVADTPSFMREYGLTGQYFSIRYGVITRHKNKDADHNLAVENWKDLCDAIKKPFAIARHKNGYRLFTNVEVNNRFISVGTDVRNIGRGIEVNAIKTAFRHQGGNIGNVVYVSDKITPEQAALLGGLNSLVYPSAPNGDTSLSSDSGEKSSPENDS